MLSQHMTRSVAYSKQEPCYRRENRAMPLYISIRIEFYNGIVRFLCHCATAGFLVRV